MTGCGQTTRNTLWRQGCILPQEAVREFGLDNHANSDEVCAVVITHDCDLASSSSVEPDVEVIPGRVVSVLNGNYAWAKSPRTLHFTANHSGERVVIELLSAKKSLVSKDVLHAFNPDSSYSLDGRQLNVLRNWLASRYQRAAFPDCFVDRMKATKAEVKLGKKIEMHGAAISFVYFDLDQGAMLERAEGEPYELSVVLVFNPGNDPVAAADAADAAALEIEQVLESCFTDAALIQLHACFAVSEDDLTVSQARVLTQWRLEHMTFRAEDDQLGVPVF